MYRDGTKNKFLPKKPYIYFTGLRPNWALVKFSCLIKMFCGNLVTFEKCIWQSMALGRAWAS